MAMESIKTISGLVGPLHEQAADLMILALAKGAKKLPKEIYDHLGGANGPVGVLLSSGDFDGDSRCDLFFTGGANGNAVFLQSEAPLAVDTGHSILYRPVPERVLPTVRWADQKR